MQERCKELSLWVRDEGEVESVREERRRVRREIF